MRAGAGPPRQPMLQKNVWLNGTSPWGTPTIPIVAPGRAMAAAVSIDCWVPTHSKRGVGADPARQRFWTERSVAIALGNARF